jgi:hypothetical protein
VLFIDSGFRADAEKGKEEDPRLGLGHCRFLFLAKNEWHLMQHTNTTTQQALAPDVINDRDLHLQNNQFCNRGQKASVRACTFTLAGKIELETPEMMAATI